MAESTSPQSYQFPHPQCISLDYLKSINACSTGIYSYMNALEKVSTVHPKLSQIAEHISLSNILWILCKVDKEEKFSVLLKCDFAEHVLYLFENRYPMDDRPRKAIQAGRRTVSETTYTALDAAHAALDAASEAASKAAYAASTAAAYAAAHAASNATYAALDATAYAASNAAASRQEEQEWQKFHFIKLLIQLENNTIDWNRKSLAEFTE